MKFDDVNLNDDKAAAPKLDLDFGLGAASTTDNKSSGFSFGGGWGGGWGGGGGGGGGGSSWNFSGAGDTAADTSKDEAKDPWGSKKSDKKKTGGFDDFNFGDLAGDGTAGDLGSVAKDDKAAEEDWAGFSSKKDKKKKKGAAAESEPAFIDVPPPPPPPVAILDDKPLDDDPWASFGSKKVRRCNRLLVMSVLTRLVDQEGQERCRARTCCRRRFRTRGGPGREVRRAGWRRRSVGRLWSQRERQEESKEGNEVSWKRGQACGRACRGCCSG